MSTVSVTYNYVSFSSGGGTTRQPRSATGPGGFTLISSIAGGTQLTGGTFGAGAQPSTLTVGNLGAFPPVAEKTYTFAFMSVSGGTPVGQTVATAVTSFDSAVPPGLVTVGESPIVVLVVYVPTGGGGVGGGSGAEIDSFNTTTGSLFSDDFVKVSPDPGGPPPPLTTSGNVDGYVSTANTEKIAATSPTSPSGLDFVSWQLLYPPVTTRLEVGPKGPTVVTIDPAGIAVSGSDLTVNAGSSVYALAFYKAPPPPPPPPPPTTCEELLQNWNALEPKTNQVLLAYYEEKLSACQGPQYAAAVAEIKSLLQGLQHTPPL